MWQKIVIILLYGVILIKSYELSAIIGTFPIIGSGTCHRIERDMYYSNDDWTSVDKCLCDITLCDVMTGSSPESLNADSMYMLCGCKYHVIGNHHSIPSYSKVMYMMGSDDGQKTTMCRVVIYHDNSDGTTQSNACQCQIDIMSRTMSDIGAIDIVCDRCILVPSPHLS